MYIVKPIKKHFLIWIVLLPFIFCEAPILKETISLFNLSIPSKTNVVDGIITNDRNGENGTKEIQYKFQIPGETTWYSGSDLTGRKNLWRPITSNAYNKAMEAQGTIQVVYLLENPWVNQPVGRAGYPLLWDDLFVWSIVFAMDIWTIIESIMIVRSYLQSRQAAENRIRYRGRYWESQME